MSTRCQVKVDVQDEIGWKEAVTLYHHCDGYPENMLPLIAKAYKDARRNMDKKAKKRNTSADYYKLGRTGSVASYLCAEEPDGFEPEAGHKLHGDIEWYYVVHAINKAGGSWGDDPQWNVDVYSVEGKPHKVVEATPVEMAAKHAEEIAEAGRTISKEYYEKKQKRIKV